jgi:8-oxo-dGTP pyrophosphatase MutT (NUDIX family)
MKKRGSSNIALAPLPQVAALPVRRTGDGDIEVLLITSRKTNRWIIPKGWPMKGKKRHEAAAQEALEEAGISGHVHKKPLGSYVYWKRRDARSDLCSVEVYQLDVERQMDVFLEKGQRQAIWVDLSEATSLTEEPGLRAILLKLAGHAQRGENAKLVSG